MRCYWLAGGKEKKAPHSATDIARQRRAWYGDGVATAAPRFGCLTINSYARTRLPASARVPPPGLLGATCATCGRVGSRASVPWQIPTQRLSRHGRRHWPRRLPEPQRRLSTLRAQLRRRTARRGPAIAL